MAKPYESREEMLAKVRQKLKEKNAGRRDPDQFIPPKAKDGDKIELYFRVLPMPEKGETCKNGVCQNDYDFFFHENGSHYIFNERHECPRLHDHEECSLCQFGWDLMADIDDPEVKKKIAGKYLANTKYAVNIYFLNIDKNPENLRGQVKWFNAPKTCYDLWEECLNSDTAGTPEDPKAHGIFYHPYEDGYTFKLVVTKQGDWNDYKQSCFLPASKSPLFKNKDGTANEAAIQKILDQRLDVKQKFGPRNNEKLEAITKRVIAKESGGGDENPQEGTEEIKGVQKGGAKALLNTPRAAPKAAPKAATATAPVETVAETAEVVAEAEAPPEETVPEETAPETPKPAPAKTTAAKAPTKPTTAVKAPAKPAAKVAEPKDDAELNALISKITTTE